MVSPINDLGIQTHMMTIRAMNAGSGRYGIES